LAAPGSCAGTFALALVGACVVLAGIAAGLIAVGLGF
jgi:hypothetical protein